MSAATWVAQAPKNIKNQNSSKPCLAEITASKHPGTMVRMGNAWVEWVESWVGRKHLTKCRICFLLLLFFGNASNVFLSRMIPACLVVSFLVWLHMVAVGMGMDVAGAVAMAEAVAVAVAVADTCTHNRMDMAMHTYICHKVIQCCSNKVLHKYLLDYRTYRTYSHTNCLENAHCSSIAIMNMKQWTLQ